MTYYDDDTPDPSTGSPISSPAGVQDPLVRQILSEIIRELSLRQPAGPEAAPAPVARAGRTRIAFMDPFKVDAAAGQAQFYARELNQLDDGSLAVSSLIPASRVPLGSGASQITVTVPSGEDAVAVRITDNDGT